MLDRLKQAGTDVSIAIALIVVCMVLFGGCQIELDRSHLHVHKKGYNSYQ